MNGPRLTIPRVLRDATRRRRGDPRECRITPQSRTEADCVTNNCSNLLQFTEEVVIMATTSPTRIDDEVYASARLVGSLMSRSTAAQIAHWARIGREVEASDGVSSRDIAGVLAGSREYDGLTSYEQAVVRAEWAERIDAGREALDLAREFAAQGRSYVELDENGDVVQRDLPVEARHRSA